MREDISLRSLVRLLTKTSLALAVVALAACQSPQIASQRPPTKPPEPPPAAAPPPVQQMPAAEAMTPAGFKVALLLPMTGQGAALGDAMFNAAQLALFDASSQGFTLRPYDTHGTPDGAAAAARQAVEGGAAVVLGPIFSPEVKAAGQVTRAANIPMVAFTTDVTAAGNGVHVLGMLPRSQVARVVGQARQRGVTRFAALAPDNDYGRAVAAAYQDVVRSAGGIVTRQEFYDPASRDVSDAVRRLAAGEGSAFEALLIPDEGTRLRAVAAALPAHGLGSDKVLLLGTALWGNDPRLGSEPALVGGWFPAPPQDEHAEFVADYQKHFNARPPGIASLAYDATALAAVLAKQTAGGSLPSVLTSPSGFAGVDGIFRLLPDGTNQRGLAVMEVTPDGARQIGPAPKSFEAAVF